MRGPWCALRILAALGLLGLLGCPTASDDDDDDCSPLNYTYGCRYDGDGDLIACTCGGFGEEGVPCTSPSETTWDDPDNCTKRLSSLRRVSAAT